MTFKCESSSGRRAQAEEVEQDLLRIYTKEPGEAVRQQIRRAMHEVELVTHLLRAAEKQGEGQ